MFKSRFSAVLSVTAIIFFLSSALFSQVAQGPAMGTSGAGEIKNTNSFGPYVPMSNPNMEKGKNKLKYTVPAFYGPSDATMPDEKAIFVEDGGEGVTGKPVLLQEFQGPGTTGSIPPDPHVAVGPDHIIATVNTDFAIYDKNGNLLKRIDSDNWFGSMIPGIFSFDPKVIYDHYAQRWMMVWLDQDDGSSRGTILIAVSDDSNPLGNWSNWVLPSNKNGSTGINSWGDYQGVGYDSLALYVTTNQFSFAGNFDYAKIRVIPKAQLLQNNTNPVTFWDFWDVRFPGSSGRVFNIRPVIHYTHSDTAYFVHVPYSGGNRYALYKVTNVSGTPQISGVAVSVSNFGYPPDAGQPGGLDPFETNGSALSNEPVYRNGYLWVTHLTVNPNNWSYSAVRYTKINTSTNQTEEQVSFGKEGYWYLYPAITVDKYENIGFTFGRSGLDEYNGAFFAGRAKGAPETDLKSYLLEAGAGPYVVTFGSGRNRWGDYMGIALDPTDSLSMWMLTEHVYRPNVWGNRVGKIRVAPFTGTYPFTDKKLLDFKTIEVNVQKDTQYIAFSNFGDTQLNITSISTGTGQFIIPAAFTGARTLNSYDTLFIPVITNASVTGIINDTVSVNISGSAPHKVALVMKGYQVVPAALNTIYAVSGSSDAGNSYTLSGSNAAASSLGASGFNDIAVAVTDPVTKVVYAVRNTENGAELLRMNSSNGEFYFYKKLPFATVTTAAINNAGELFILTERRFLSKYDHTNNITTFIDTVAVTLAGMAFDPVTDELYGGIYKPLGTNRDQIVKISETGDTTNLGAAGTGKIIRGVAFEAGRSLLVLTGNANQAADLVRFNTLSKSASLTGNTGKAGLITITQWPNPVNDVKESDELTPRGFTLMQNYPNPFNPSTMIKFGIPELSEVRITVYNILGQTVKVLADKVYEPGNYEINFNTQESALVSGVYFYEMSARSITGNRNYNEIRKMILAK